MRRSRVDAAACQGRGASPRAYRDRRSHRGRLMSAMRGRIGREHLARVLERRLRSHRLSAPARTIAEAAEHMLATQGQEFWGGRWALAARTRGDPSVRDVDAAFDRGEIVRSWTMRGTIHVIPARDLAWVLSVTARTPAPGGRAVRRVEGIDAAELARAERLARARARAAATGSPARSCSPCSSRAASARPAARLSPAGRRCRCGRWSARDPSCRARAARRASSTSCSPTNG